MCTVSGKLKLCTCATKNIGRLKNYWVFYRLVKGKYETVMGCTIAPYFINPTIDLINKQLLLKLLNDGNVFDVDINPKRGDRLLLSFSCGNSYEEQVYYGFAFKNKQWVELEYNAFEWMEKHDEELFGKITNALHKQEERESS